MILKPIEYNFNKNGVSSIYSFILSFSFRWICASAVTYVRSALFDGWQKRQLNIGRCSVNYVNLVNIHASMDNEDRFDDWTTKGAIEAHLVVHNVDVEKN